MVIHSLKPLCAIHYFVYTLQDKLDDQMLQCNLQMDVKGLYSLSALEGTDLLLSSFHLS